MSTPAALPLDDPRWLPMTDIFARLHPRLGGQAPAEHDLSMALAEGRLHCLNRYQTRGGVWERKLISLLCWIGREVQYWSRGRFTTRRQQNWSCPKSWADPRLSFHLCDRGVGFDQSSFGILYAWQPDLERIWPAIFPPIETTQSSSKPGSADAWIDELFPTTWHLLKPEPMHGRIVEEIEKRNKEARRRDKNAPLMVAPSLTALRAALKKRRKA
jgi:hypothetical protein